MLREKLYFVNPELSRIMLQTLTILPEVKIKMRQFRCMITRNPKVPGSCSPKHCSQHAPEEATLLEPHATKSWSRALNAKKQLSVSDLGDAPGTRKECALCPVTKENRRTSLFGCTFEKEAESSHKTGLTWLSKDVRAEEEQKGGGADTPRLSGRGPTVSSSPPTVTPPAAFAVSQLRAWGSAHRGTRPCSFPSCNALWSEASEVGSRLTQKQTWNLSSNLHRVDLKAH